MSRIGRKPIEIPAGVKVSLDGNTVNVEGPKGKLAFTHRDEIQVDVAEDGKTVNVVRGSEVRTVRALHGLTRALSRLCERIEATDSCGSNGCLPG